jgi:hypothetical protein
MRRSKVELESGGGAARGQAKIQPTRGAIDQETATQLLTSGGTQMGAQADSGCSRSRNEVPVAKLEKLMASDAQGDS